MSARTRITSYNRRRSTSFLSASRYLAHQTDGTVATPHGIVDVIISERMWTRRPSGREVLGAGAYMCFIHAGREYRLSYSGKLTARGAVRVASRFARDVVAGTLDQKRQRRAARRARS